MYTTNLTFYVEEEKNLKTLKFFYQYFTKAKEKYGKTFTLTQFSRVLRISDDEFNGEVINFANKIKIHETEKKKLYYFYCECRDENIPNIYFWFDKITRLYYDKIKLAFVTDSDTENKGYKLDVSDTFYKYRKYVVNMRHKLSNSEYLRYKGLSKNPKKAFTLGMLEEDGFGNKYMIGNRVLASDDELNRFVDRYYEEPKDLIETPRKRSVSVIYDYIYEYTELNYIQAFSQAIAWVRKEPAGTIYNVQELMHLLAYLGRKAASIRCSIKKVK